MVSVVAPAPEHAKPTERTRLRFPAPEWLLGLGALLILAVLVLGVRLEDLVGPTHLDSVAAREIGGRAVRQVADRAFWNDALRLGGPVSVAVVMITMTWWAARRRDVSGAVVAIVGPVLTIAAVEWVAKPLFDRRAPKGALSYPSGHVAATAALAAVVLLLVYRYAGPRLALLSTPPALVFAGLVFVGVMVVKWHYLTDSVGGVAFGVGVVLCVAGSVDRLVGSLVPLPPGDR